MARPKVTNKNDVLEKILCIMELHGKDIDDITTKDIRTFSLYYAALSAFGNIREFKIAVKEHLGLEPKQNYKVLRRVIAQVDHFRSIKGRFPKLPKEMQYVYYLGKYKGIKRGVWNMVKDREDYREWHFFLDKLVYGGWQRDIRENTISKIVAQTKKFRIMNNRFPNRACEMPYFYKLLTSNGWGEYAIYRMKGATHTEPDAAEWFEWLNLLDKKYNVFFRV